MAAFAYTDSPDPIRADLIAAHRAAWQHIAAPGTWLTGAQRVAVADETRRARGCALCGERKHALSPNAVRGEHAHGGGLPPAMVEAVHRVTTDAARLSERWLQGLLGQGLGVEQYVEALAVAVIAISIDRFHHALGLPLEPLPLARSGEPTRERPDGIVEGEAWVPMLDARRAGAAIGLRVPSTPFVIRALSLVPAEVRAWRAVSAAQYLSEDRMLGFEKFRALDRSQIELVAGRVSALNECFY